MMQTRKRFTVKHWPVVLKKIIIGAFRNINVNFLVAGTQKGGTSALSWYLSEHPQICMAQPKEIHFFDREKFWRIRKINYFFYHSYFKPKSTHAAIGESTPIYMYWQSAVKRIWEYNPEMKLIIILRNPVERAYSQWNMERMNKTENLTFWDAIQREPERRKKFHPHQHRVYSYIDRGFYASQLKRILRYFPRNQLLVFKNEQLRNKPQDTLDNVAKFLDIETFGTVETREVHARKYISRITLAEKKYLNDLYRDDIRELEKLLGWDCSGWLD